MAHPMPLRALILVEDEWVDAFYAAHEDWADEHVIRAEQPDGTIRHSLYAEDAPVYLHWLHRERLITTEAYGRKLRIVSQLHMDEVVAGLVPASPQREGESPWN